MAATASQKHIVAFFFQGGASSALFRWLAFRLFVAQKKLIIATEEAPQTSSLSAIQLLQRWQDQHSNALPSSWFLTVLNGLAALIGCTAMAGILTMNTTQRINIWIPLALFAVLPLLMTFSSAYVSLVSSSKQQLHGHPWFTFLIHKLKLAPYLPYKNTLLPWLFWQTQYLALVFSFSALLSFLVLATFQDYHFGWSSTLINESATMESLMSIISWPWHGVVSSPSIELIEQSRILTGSIEQSDTIQQRWWLTLVMAILVYGILPRLILAIGLRQRFVNQLTASILNSADIEQFMIAQQHQTSNQPITSDEKQTALGSINIDPSAAQLITWQQTHHTFDNAKNLGSDDWLADEAWLASEQSQFAKPVFIIVDLQQTPTGELADILQALQNKNASVTLVLSTESCDERRLQTHIKSWQFFAQQHHITLKSGVKI